MKSIISKIFCVVFTVLFMFSVPFTAYAVDLEYMEEHGEEGEQLWQNYLDAIEPIKNGECPELTAFIEERVNSTDPLSEHYADLTYRDKQEYLDMSTYDKILWESVIVYPFSRKNNGGNYYRSLYGWKGFASDLYRDYFEFFCDDEDGAVMVEAYAELMEWLYYYYDSTGAFYNFIDGKDSIDYINDYYNNVATTSKEEDESSQETSETSTSSSANTSEKAVSAVNSNLTTSSSTEERGIWSNFLDSVKSHLFSVIPLAVFVAVSAGIVVYKKRFNNNNKK